jgi:hypothetical protein
MYLIGVRCTSYRRVSPTGVHLTRASHRRVSLIGVRLIDVSLTSVHLSQACATRGRAGLICPGRHTTVLGGMRWLCLTKESGQIHFRCTDIYLGSGLVLHV